MIEKEEYNQKQVPKISWKFLNCSRSRSLFLCVCRQLRWTSATEFFVLLNRRLRQAQLVHRERQGGGEEKMERSEQIHLLSPTFGFLWLRLLTPHVCSAQALIHILERKRSRGEKKIGWRNEEKSQKQRAGDSIWMMSLLAWSPVCVRPRHKPGISAAVTFPEAELVWEHDWWPRGRRRCCCFCGHVTHSCDYEPQCFQFRSRRATELTLIPTGDPQWILFFGALRDAFSYIYNVTCDILPVHLYLQLWKPLF